MSSHQESRLALIPLAPLKTDLKPVKTAPVSPPAPTTELRDLPPTSSLNPKEMSRIDKWTQMMKVAQRDKGSNVERWTFDEKKKRKVGKPCIAMVTSSAALLTLGPNSYESACIKVYRIDGAQLRGGPSSTVLVWNNSARRTSLRLHGRESPQPS